MVIINLLHLQMAKYTRPLLIGLILCVSHSRTFSIINGYSAPLEIYKHFEHHDDVGTGKNWYMQTWQNGRAGNLGQNALGMVDLNTIFGCRFSGVCGK